MSISIRNSVSTLLAILAAVAMTACGERSQVVSYQNGKYQGKPDTPPYADPPFNGNEQFWDNTERTRNQNQTEYQRFDHR